MRAHKYRGRQPKVEEKKSSGSGVPRPGVERTAKVVGPLARTNLYSADVFAEARVWLGKESNSSGERADKAVVPPVDERFVSRSMSRSNLLTRSER